MAESAERMNELRKSSTMDSQTRVDLDHAIEVVDWGVRTFGSYVFSCVSIVRATLKRILQAGLILTLPSLPHPSLSYSPSLLICHSQSD